MRRLAIAAVSTLCAWLVISCGASPPGGGATSATPGPTGRLVLLTRDGCMNTDRFRANLDEALKAAGKPLSYETIDEGTLPATDPRVGYPTPTLLVGEKDLFGLPVPTPPFPEPT